MARLEHVRFDVWVFLRCLREAPDVELEGDAADAVRNAARVFQLPWPLSMFEGVVVDFLEKALARVLYCLDRAVVADAEPRGD